jgi:hypothetical protein
MYIMLLQYAKERIQRAIFWNSSACAIVNWILVRRPWNMWDSIVIVVMFVYLYA